MKEKTFTQNTVVLKVGYAKVLISLAFALILSAFSTFAQAPPVPVATAATSVTATSFDANWGVSTGAILYFLDVSTDAAFGSFVGAYNNMNVGNVTTYTVTGVSPSTTCYYYRVYAYSVGNVSAASNVISVGACGSTDIHETSDLLVMRAYPNPVKDRLFVRINKTNDIVVTISDILGKEVKKLSESELVSGLDITGLENGIYFVKVKQAESELVERIIINK